MTLVKLVKINYGVNVTLCNLKARDPILKSAIKTRITKKYDT